jgi:exonuclease SbcD
MRILHTADWHLGDRLGRVDRTEDLRRAVERIAGYCAEEKVDVLLVAGDLFSEMATPDGLREAIRHLQEVFQGFLRGGGTLLTFTGNHDKESFCQTLRHAMCLASPAVGDHPGELVSGGRFYLATGPTLLRLGDRTSGKPIQFLLMPYPTPSRYLADEAAQKYQSLDEKNRLLMAAYTAKIRELRADPSFDERLPTVLSAHVAVMGCDLSRGLFRLTEQEDVIVSDEDMTAGYAYVALGHIHKPQALGGRSYVRYCGSIERLDLGEKDDEKSVLVVDVDPKGMQGEPRTLPLDATPMYDVDIHFPKAALPELPQLYPHHEKALVRIRCTYTAGVDNREETLRELERIFPRWYERQLTESSELGKTLVIGEAVRTKSFEDTVRDYLCQELTNHDEALREAVLARAEALLREMQA